MGEVSTRRTDIAVIGGGLAGLMAARQLAGTGREVTVVAPARRPDRRTTALLGGSVDVLKAIGVWPAVEDVAQSLRSIRIVDATHRLIRAPEVLFNAAELGLPAFGYNVPNEALLTALENSALDHGVRFLEGIAATLRTDPASASVVVGNSGTLEAQLVVACDGRSSPTRVAAGIGAKTTKGSQSAVVCEFDHRYPHEDVSTEFHTEHGPFTTVPLPGNRSALVWVTETEEAERVRSLTVDEVAGLIEQHSQSLLGDISVTSGIQTFPLGSLIADRLSDTRLVLLGEAAHALPPIGAQGFNLTIRDIECLATLVQDSRDSGAEAVTREYDRKRRFDISVRRGAVDLVNMSLLSNALPVQLLRGAGLFALARIGPLRRSMMRLGLDL